MNWDELVRERKAIALKVCSNKTLTHPEKVKAYAWDMFIVDDDASKAFLRGFADEIEAAAVEIGNAKAEKDKSDFLARYQK